MNWLNESIRRIRFLLERGKLEDELAEEMRLHRELRAEQSAREGASAEDAAAAASRRFGNDLLVRETARDAWGWAWLDSIVQDLAYAARSLKSHPGFTAVAVLSLALGIGANTAIFSIINAVLLRSLPVEDPQRLVRVRMERSTTFTNPIWEQIRDRQKAFDSVLAVGDQRFDLASGGESRYAQGLWVSGDYFRALGVAPLVGRVFTPRDDVRGMGPDGKIAVISHKFWRSYFNSDPNVVGRTVRLDRQPFTVVGVTPPWFRGLDVDQGYDVAVPLACEPVFHSDRSWLDQRSTWWLGVVGRLPAGVSMQQAEQSLNSIARETFRATVPGNWGADDRKSYLDRSFTLLPASTGYSAVGDQYRKALLTLMCVVGIVLLIACANVANLLLARGAARRRELSIRLSVGAGRGRLIRQLLTESLLLSTLGAAVGLLFARWGATLLVGFFATQRSPIDVDVTPDLTVLSFAIGVAVATGLLFGLAPALLSTRVAPNDAMKEHARGVAFGASRFRLGQSLVAAQVGLSLVLVVGAGLFLSTLRNLLTTGPGLDPSGVLAVNIDTLEKVPKQIRTELYETIQRRIAALPGVDATAIAAIAPFSGMQWNMPVEVDGYKAKSRKDPVVWFNRVTPGYFSTLRIPILMGRDFQTSDRIGSQRVAIINQSTARHFFAGQSPLGKTLGIEGGPDAPLEQHLIVGVVADAKYRDLREKDSRTVYLATAQEADAWPDVRLFVRSSVAAPLAPAIRQTIGAIDPGLALEFRNYESVLDDSMIQERTIALLSGFFGALALLLAMVGLYGVTAYGVARRQGEIGIRVALGARRISVVWLVLSDVCRMLAAGVVLGLAVSLALGRYVATLLYGVKPADATTLATAAAVLILATVMAALLPARRAARLDPLQALREQ